jgi:hypothetical protein
VTSVAARIYRQHDGLVRYVFSRPLAMAIVLRRVLPARLLAHVDFRSLRHLPTVQTGPLLGTREPDLLFTVDLCHAGHRFAIYIVVEHQSTLEDLLPWRALVYLGEVWQRHIKDLPTRPRTLPFILPILLAQHPARNTPTRLSEILELPPGFREILGTPVELELLVDDLTGSVLDDHEAPWPFRALVELARALLLAYGNPDSLTESRDAGAVIRRRFESLRSR